MPSIIGIAAARAGELKKHGYEGCVRTDGNPCHCAKIIAGTLHCGETKQKTPRTPHEAATCQKRTLRQHQATESVH